MRNKLTSVVMFAVLAMFAMAPLAQADNDFLRHMSMGNGLDIGIGNLNFGFQAKYVSDSNIYRKPTYEISDMIMILSPAVRLSIETRRNDLSLGYSNDIYSFSDYDQEDFTAKTAYMNYTLDSLGGLVVSINDTYNITNSIRPEQSSPERKEFLVNEGRGGIAYTFPGGRLTTEVFYSQMLLEFENVADEALNRKDEEYGAAIYYKVLPKTAVFVEYLMGAKDYIDSVDENTDPDSDMSAANLGLRWDATAKMTGFLKGGVEKREYVNANYAQYDGDLFSVDGKLGYRMSNNTTVNIILSRSLMESVYAGNVAESISASANYMRNKYGIGLKTRMVNRVDLSMNAEMESDTYKSLNTALTVREDEIVTFDMSLDYNFHKTFSAGVGYEYVDKTSNDPGQEESHSNWMVRVRYNI